MINTTMGSQKKFYNRWALLNQTSKILNKCKLVGDCFKTIHYGVKSVIDMMVYETKGLQDKK